MTFRREGPGGKKGGTGRREGRKEKGGKERELREGRKEKGGRSTQSVYVCLFS